MSKKRLIKRPYPRTAPCAILCRADGNKVGAMIGEDYISGVAGFGDTLADALRDLAEEIEKETEETAMIERDAKIDLQLSVRTLRFLATQDPRTPLIVKNGVPLAGKAVVAALEGFPADWIFKT